jgi:hypothetical protein
LRINTPAADAAAAAADATISTTELCVFFWHIGSDALKCPID